MDTTEAGESGDHSDAAKCPRRQSQSQSRAHTRAAGRVRVQRHRAVQTADQVAAKRVADRQYQRDRRRLGAEEQSAEHFERVAAQRVRVQRRRTAQRADSVAAFYEAAMIDVHTAGLLNIAIHDCGTLSVQCNHCSAKFFVNERLAKSSLTTPKFGLCCGDGKIKLWSVPDPPEPLAHVLTDLSTSSRQFRRDIRRYNCALCMASMQATEIQFPSGPSVFKIRGEVHRFVGPMHAADGQQPKWLQTFFVDAAMQVEFGGQRFGPVDPGLMTDRRTDRITITKTVQRFGA